MLLGNVFGGLLLGLLRPELAIALWMNWSLNYRARATCSVALVGKEITVSAVLGRIGARINVRLAITHRDFALAKACGVGAAKAGWFGRGFFFAAACRKCARANGNHRGASDDFEKATPRDFSILVHSSAPDGGRVGSTILLGYFVRTKK